MFNVAACFFKLCINLFWDDQTFYSPTELIWHSLNKDYLQIEYKAKNLMLLKAGIMAFWATLTPGICFKFNGHLKKFVPKVIEAQGGPSGC